MATLDARADQPAASSGWLGAKGTIAFSRHNTCGSPVAPIADFRISSIQRYMVGVDAESYSAKCPFRRMAWPTIRYCGRYACRSESFEDYVMSRFGDVFTISETLSLPSALSTLAGGDAPDAGVYDRGLITLIDRSSSNSILKSWAWLLKDDAIALATMWHGNVVFWSPSKAACFLFETQYGRSTFIDNSALLAFDQVFCKPRFKEQILSESRFITISQSLGAVGLGQCFIATPWPMLGGSGRDDTFQSGDVAVYLSLVSQTMRQVLDAK